MAMTIGNMQLPAILRQKKISESDAFDVAERRESFHGHPNTGFSRGKRLSQKASTHTDWVKYVGSSDEVERFNVLLVGSQQWGRQALCNTLSQHLNFKMYYFEASNGGSALSEVACKKVNLIIFEDDVADMSGLEFLGRLNKQQGVSKIPVIEILNAEAASNGIKALRMGAHDFLLKDFEGRHFEMLPILVTRIYSEIKVISELRQQACVHQTVADSIPSIIYRMSLQGGPHDVHISREISELGLSPEQWGSDAELHHQLCHEADRPIVKAALERSFKTGALFQCDYRIITLGGALRWFRDKAKIIADKYGRPLFLQGVMTDITCIKSMQNELRHFHDLLDKMVKDRTERLERRIAILESCNASLGDNYHAMNRMYLDLFVRTQAQEGGGYGEEEQILAGG